MRRPEEKSDSETDRLYEESLRKIKNGLKHLSFDEAAKLVDVDDEVVRRSIVDDCLKVLIAERHFSGGTSLESLARELRTSPKRLAQAKAEMLGDVEAAAIEAYAREKNQQAGSA
jgi:AraC-like DNA-binding protein